MSRIAILGATGGVGSSLARRLTEHGHPLILIGRSQECLAELAGELDQPIIVNDLTNSDSLATAVESALKPDECLGGLVNCVGSLVLKPAHRTTDKDFRATIETNLFTSFATVRVATSMLRDQGGSVVLFSSAAANIGIANHEAIAAAKAGINGLTRSAAATYARYNIRFNAISPGLVKTPLTSGVWSNPATEKASQKMHALGRLGEPEQIASLAEWLLNPENDWITGQIIGLDGGLGSVIAK